MVEPPEMRALRPRLHHLVAVGVASVLALALPACAKEAAPAQPPRDVTPPAPRPTAEPLGVDAAAPMPAAAPSAATVDPRLAPFFDGSWKAPSAGTTSPSKCEGGDARECFVIAAQLEWFRITDNKPMPERLADAHRWYERGCAAAKRSPCEPAVRVAAKRDALLAKSGKARAALACELAVDGMAHMASRVDARRIFRDDCAKLYAPACAKTFDLVASHADRAVLLGYGCGDEHYCKKPSAKSGYCALPKRDRKASNPELGPAVIDMLATAATAEVAPDASATFAAAIQRGLTTFVAEDEADRHVPVGARAEDLGQLPQTRRALVQLVLDLRELSPYWHAEKAGRTPLKLAKGAFVTDGDTYRRGGVPVVLVDAPDDAAAKAAAALVITSIDTRADGLLVVHFRYPVEGVVGSAVVSRGRSGELQVDSANVAER